MEEIGGNHSTISPINRHIIIVLFTHVELLELNPTYQELAHAHIRDKDVHRAAELLKEVHPL